MAYSAKISIKIIDQGNPEIYGEATGVISINNFDDYFTIATNYWKVSQYQKQWREGLERIKNHDTSCLMQSIQNPETSEPLIMWWILYKIDSKIHLQNHLYVSEIYDEYIGKDKVITPENCYDFIPKRETHLSTGEEITEWIVAL